MGSNAKGAAEGQGPEHHIGRPFFATLDQGVYSPVGTEGCLSRQSVLIQVRIFKGNFEGTEIRAKVDTLEKQSVAAAFESLSPPITDFTPAQTVLRNAVKALNPRREPVPRGRAQAI